MTRFIATAVDDATFALVAKLTELIQAINILNANLDDVEALLTASQLNLATGNSHLEEIKNRLPATLTGSGRLKVNTGQ